MKKRWIASICALALVLGLGLGLSANVNAQESSFQVGYAKVDITPYSPHKLAKGETAIGNTTATHVTYVADNTEAALFYWDSQEGTYLPVQEGSPAGTHKRVVTTTEGVYAYQWTDSKGNRKYGDILSLPLAGGGYTMTRQSTTTLIDDNGDGKVDHNDGIFATCIAVTDDEGDTVLMYSNDLINGSDSLQKAVSAQVIEKINALYPKLKLDAESIQMQGTHTHNAVDLGKYAAYYHPETGSLRFKSWELEDVSGKRTGKLIHAIQGYDTFETWYPYLVQQLVDAAVAAVENQAEATMSKGQVDASEVAGKTMNGVRHYTRVTNDGELYVYGAHFNQAFKDYKGYETGTGTYKLSDEDDTLYCLQFSFENGADPIVIVNWRAHPASNGTSGSGLRLNISSDYVNAMNYVLEQAGYRPYFMQGAAGNMGIDSALSDWLTQGYPKFEGNADTDGDGSVSDEVGDSLKTNRYGKALSQVVLKCLEKSNMKAVNGGSDVKTTAIIYNTELKSWNEEIQYCAGVAAKTYHDASNTGSLFKYPDDVYTKTYKNQTVYQMLDEEQQLRADYYRAQGQHYLVSSNFHANHLVDEYLKEGYERLDLRAFMLGSGAAFVVAPGEMYDRYNSQLTWDDLKNLTQQQVYEKVNSVNEWDKLIDSTYGTPFVMGYATNPVGYFPASIAYEYNKGSAQRVIGSYEAHITAGQQGFGEKTLDIFDDMLDSLVNDGNVNNELFQTGWCEGCQKMVTWEAYSTNYNHVSSAEYTPDGAHYFLDGNVNMRVQTVYGTYCLDLRGHHYQATVSRCFYVGGSDGTQTGTLTIMDTVGDGTISGQGGSTQSVGATIYVQKNSTLNFCGGTIYHRAHPTLDNKVIQEVVRVAGTMNMYGGVIKGGNEVVQGRAVDIRSTGTMNISGGAILAGQNDLPGSAIYANGIISVSGSPKIQDLHVTTVNKLKVDGLFHGDLELSYFEEVTAGKKVGYALNDAAIVSGGITVKDTPLTLAVKGNTIVAAEKTLTACVCGENCQVIELTDAMFDAMGGKLASGHYKLTENITAQLAQTGVSFDKDVCIDLNGYSITCLSGRLFQLEDYSQLTISDSSQAKTGKLITAGLPFGGNSANGGMFLVHGYASLTLNDVTLELAENAQPNTWRGGIIYTNGEAILNRCTVTGGKVVANGEQSSRGGNLYCAGSGKLHLNDTVVQDGTADNGGNIYVYGKLYLSGNTKLLGGTATSGYCVTLSSGKEVYISGNVVADQIRFAGNSADTLFFNGDFTGNVTLKLVAAQNVEGEDIGNCTGSIYAGQITIEGSELKVNAEDGQLILRDAKDLYQASVKDEEGNVRDYKDLQEAIEAYTSGTLVLLTDVDSSVTLTKDMVVDIGGCKFAPTIWQGVVITCKDSMTADYNVEDDVFTKVPAALADQVVAAEGYLKYTHEDGSVSFHAVQTKVENAYCRPSVAGIYYGSTFKGDRFVAEMVDSFGVAVSIMEDPMTEEGPSPYSLFTTFGKEVFEAGNTAEYASTILTDILDADLGVYKNRENGEKLIYARSYIKLTDGSYIWSSLVRPADGSADGITLKMILEYASANWDSLKDLQKSGLLEMYGKFRLVLDKWATGNIKAAYYAQ